LSLLRIPCWINNAQSLRFQQCGLLFRKGAQAGTRNRRTTSPRATCQSRSAVVEIAAELCFVLRNAVEDLGPERILALDGSSDFGPNGLRWQLRHILHPELLRNCQNNCAVTHSHETPSLLSVRQITRHCRLERALSKESANEWGMPAEDGTCRHKPTFVRLTTVQSKIDEPLFKIILATFNTRVR
jgi:hypothetical protein